MIVKDIHDILDPADQAYFRETREKRLGRTLEELVAGRDGEFAAFGPKLEPLRHALKYQPWFGGDGPLFVVADQVPNFFLARREVLAALPWDDKIKVEYEHLDWFLSLQKHGKWKAAVCLDARATHWRAVAERDYFVYRRTSSPAHMYQKWGLATITHQF